MQNAKDSFYITLRNRLALLAPGRVVTLRAVQRPAILVEEAEAPTGELVNDCFVLRWTAQAVVDGLSASLTSMECEVHYASSGSQTNAGLDRGRAIAAMDAELMTILQPFCSPKMNYTVTPAAAMQTNIFWTEPAFKALTTVRDQITRVATITVFAFEEPGEQ